MTPEDAKQAKLDRIAPLLKPEYRTRRRAAHFDCLDEAQRASAGIVPTGNVSENPYHRPSLEMFARHDDGLVLDVGAGKRDTYRSNVVYLEVVAYDSTDVLAAGEWLPFDDATFDAVHSNAVMEHVRDPFACAREVMRVLKPGGDLICSVPFLQPYHGFPRHYYNMTHQGIHNLFPGMEVFGVEVYEELRPFTALQWMVGAWAVGLPEPERQRFLDLKLSEVMKVSAEEADAQAWISLLPPGKNHELACASTLFARKPATRARSLECLEATYGAGAAVYDITARMNALMAKGFFFLSCDFELARLFGDPAPGQAKRLAIRWRREGATGAISGDEHHGRLRTPLWI